MRTQKQDLKLSITSNQTKLKNMNYILHLNTFFQVSRKDKRLKPAHICLYLALFQFWNIKRFLNPISIARSQTMSYSKIKAKSTYYKILKELEKFGYIKYEPSENPQRGSKVYLLSLASEETKNNLITEYGNQNNSLTEE